MAASPGIAIGRAYLLPRRVIVEEASIEASDVSSELERFERGLRATDAELARLQQSLVEAGGADGADAVGAYRTILESEDLAGAARRLISEELVAAPWAVHRAIQPVRRAFERVEDPFFRERGRDIDALINRLLRALLGAEEHAAPERGVRRRIGIGTELRPVDPFHLQRGGLAGLVTEGGGKTSHASILVRALGTPYVLGVDGLDEVRPDTVIIVDGDAGEVIVDPDEATLAAYQNERRQQRRRARQVGRGKSLPALTRDGVEIALGANIEAVSDVARAVAMGASGIGLLRTEFLYLERHAPPDEDEQLQDALGALRAAAGRPVTFRTLDIGSDKVLPGVATEAEANPALGLRAIRLSLRNPDLFRTQLRALYRASAFGPLRIMFPMISGITELAETREICDGVCRDLERQGHAFDPRVPVGCMIETPSAALTTDHLAARSDFFSIGTNDLMQYSFAADRGNENLVHLYHPLHPAFLRLLKITVEAAGRAARPISMCGDMASDPAFTWILLGLGLRELSMPARYIPAVKSIVRQTELGEAERLCTEAMSLPDERTVEALVLPFMRRRFPLELGLDAPTKAAPAPEERGSASPQPSV